MPAASLRASVGGEAGISLLAAAYEAPLASYIPHLPDKDKPVDSNMRSRQG